MRIKRVKQAPPGPLDAMTGRPAPAVHYATVVDPIGCVSAWTADPSAAAEFGEDVAARVKRHYACRPNAGKLTFEQSSPPKAAEKESPTVETEGAEKPEPGKQRPQGRSKP